MTESLKEYLVNIGFNVDKSSFRDMSVKLKNTKETLKTLASSSNVFAKTFGAAAVGVAGAATVLGNVLLTVNKGISDFLSNEAKLDLQTERTARKFWAAEKNVRAYQNSLEALGESESDLFYMTDEQYSRFLQLNSLSKSLEAPAEADETLRKIRDIQFEFSKIKVFTQYLKRWITYYIGKMSGGTMDRIRSKLSKVNELLQKNLPKIAKYIANVYDVFIRLGEAAMNILGWVVDMFSHMLPDSVKDGSAVILSVLTGLAIALMSGPIGWIIAGLTTVLLLIDDFKTWQRGGKSAFDWTKFDNIFGQSSKTPTNEEEVPPVTKAAKAALKTSRAIGSKNPLEWWNVITTWVDYFKSSKNVKTNGEDVVKNYIEGMSGNGSSTSTLGTLNMGSSPVNVNNNVNIEIMESKTPMATAKTVAGIIERHAMTPITP